ncbi:MAG TPA: tail fiber protein [Fimbriimonadaceae bacterium]|nr:tail fiber protein [Fimbriimonadaceae bacterium]
MADPFIGEVKLVPYNFAPVGWAICAGQLLPISQNTALFSLIGTYYGGDGRSTFALPDLRGRVAVHSGQGPGLSPYTIGQTGGVEGVSLGTPQLPPHGHSVAVSSTLGNHSDPAGEHLGTSPMGLGFVYGVSPNATMPDPTTVSGGGQPHENRQPHLAMYYIIALEGVFPPHP